MSMSDATLANAIDTLERLTARSTPRYALALTADLYAHLATMPDRMRPMLGVPEKREKLMRWLGFMQGALWALGVADLETMKRMNMPPPEAP